MADDLSIIPSYTGGDYGRTATASAQPFKGIVIHVAGKPDLKSELDYSSHPDPNRPGYYGYHYLIDRDGKVYQTAPDNVRTNHIMPNSQFGLNNSNAIGVSFIGGAPAGKDPLPLTPEQLSSGRALVGQLTTQYGIKPNMVVSHGQLDPDTRGPGQHLGPDDTAEGADFLSAYRGPPPTQSTTASPSPSQPPGTTINSTSLSPQGRDAIIRTVAAEADHPGGDAAVAAVIRNRLQSGQWGNTPESVVKAPGQFSAWNAVTGYGGGAGANNLVNISPNSSTYQRIGGVVDDIFSGNTPDPTKGALNFYAPGGMPGGKAPGWWSQVSNPIHIGAQWYGTAPGENARVTGGSSAAPLPAPGAQARPFTPTPVQAPGPMDPTAQAGGPGAPLGTPGSTVNPPIPTTPGTTINSNPIASLGGKIGDLAGSLQKDLGKSDDDKAQAKPEIKPDIPPAPGARNISPLLGGPGGIGQGQVSPVYAQRMAALNQPMTWGSAPPGQNPWTGFGVQAQPPVYGTSLMSNLQMLNDPTWMDQMAGGGSYG